MDPPQAFPLLERESELAGLREMLVAAVAGRGGAAFIEGPAGIGKTRLLAAAAEEARGLGVQVLAARGGELEQDYAYGVVRQLFERAAPPEEGAAAAAGRVLGAPGAPVAAFAALHGLFWLTAELAERQPLMLVADDLHWSDEASLRFLSYLQRRVRELPALVVGAARRSLHGRTAALLARIAGDARVIAPAPLSLAAVAELSGPSRAAECLAATGGNPFLCTIFAAGAEGPDVAAEVVRRMAALPAPAAALARAVAALGSEADLGLAAALAGLDLDAAAAAAGALASQRLIEGGARLRFVHPLLRSAVEEALPGPERALLHARAARLLAARGAAAEHVALHLLAAPPGESDAAATLREAARAAAARGDAQLPVRLLRRAAQEPPDAAVLHELGVAELRAGEPEPAVTHLQDALALGAPARRDLALALRIARRYRESVAMMAEAIVQERDADAALSLEGELHQTAMMTPETYAAIGERFADLDRPVDAGTRGGRALLAALATEACLRVDDAARVRRLAAMAFEHGLLEESEAHSGLWVNVAFPLIFAEGFDLARAMCEAATAPARTRGSPVEIARVHLVAGMLNLRAGAVREAEADARIALEVGRDAGLHPWPIAVDVLVEALIERGELAEAERVAGDVGESPVGFLTTWPLYARAALRLAQGRAADAARDLEEVGRRGRDGWRPWNPAMFPYRGLLALARLRLGDAEGARAAAGEDVALARRWGAPRALGVALRVRGLATGSLDDLRAAVAMLETAQAPVEHARALVDLGAAIAASGRRIEAREPLAAGLELAHRCGAPVLAQRAREQALAAGARPRRVQRSGVEALTPGELRVAHLAAEGLTNRRIAEALFVTVRTVEVHLTHAYQKLGIASRDGLSDALREGAPAAGAGALAERGQEPSSTFSKTA